MRYIILSTILLCSSCFWQEPAQDYMRPGTYVVSIFNREYSCTDGTHQYDQNNYMTEWVISRTRGQWELFLASEDGPEAVLICRQDGPELYCTADGNIIIPGICTYPFIVTVKLHATRNGFVGDVTWLYRFVVCSNGNTGNCIMTADVEGCLNE